MRNILNKLAKAGLFLDIDKCEFLCKEVKYLGFIIRAGESVTVDPVKVKAILYWEAPTSVKGVRSFLGFANFYRCFIKKFSEISSPLIALTKKGSIWRWGTEENSAFEQLKRIFATKPVLAQWDPDQETVMEVDCSGYALGRCLSQKDSNGTLRPVAYYSRRLNSAEVNYPRHDREMLALVSCLREWQAELQSVAKPFTIYSDHKNLKYFTSKRLLNERQVRYSELLQLFNFNLEWRPGKVNERSDALSRRDQDKPLGLSDERTEGRIMRLLPTINANPAAIAHQGKNTTKERDPAAEATIFSDDNMQALWKRGVELDEDWRRARDAVQAGERGFPPDIASKLTANIAECNVGADGVLRGRENRIWVPDYEPLRTAIMQEIHDSPLTGHPGRDTMVGIILRRWFWPKLSQA